LDVTPEVRTAVHATMPRVVVEGICIEGDTVLLVKGSRGLNDGRWSLPGGYLRFGETPEDGVLREIREEVGAEAQILRFSGIHGRLGQKTGLHWILLFYRTRLLGSPQPDPDEIAEARYVPVHEAAAMLHDPAMAEAVQREAADRT
jgi:ADP-ribose pyrophosphatase YjhB (NUDIX family)